MRTTQQTGRRGRGVSVTLDPEIVNMLDQRATAAGMTRAALLSRIIAEWVAGEAEDQALLSQAEAILDDPKAASIPWEEAKARLGL